MSDDEIVIAIVCDRNQLNKQQQAFLSQNQSRDRHQTSQKSHQIFNQRGSS